MFVQEALLYPYNALEPYYSAETLKIHYDILYKGYVENSNKTLVGLQKARQTGDYSDIKCLEKNLSFFGSGVILHKLFFENMGPPIPSAPSNQLHELINKNFGDFNKFKSQFTQAAKAVEASRLDAPSLGSRNKEIRSFAM